MDQTNNDYMAQEEAEFQEENIESMQSPIICEHCGLPKYMQYAEENVFRGGNKVEIETENVEEEEQKQVLRGPNGEPLLNDILTGGDYTNQQEGYNDNNYVEPAEEQIKIPDPVITPIQPPVQPQVQPPVQPQVQPPVQPQASSTTSTTSSSTKSTTSGATTSKTSNATSISTPHATPN